MAGAAHSLAFDVRNTPHAVIYLIAKCGTIGQNTAIPAWGTDDVIINLGTGGRYDKESQYGAEEPPHTGRSL
jgi:hypothetical protein